jgi:hypothetical protein
MQNLICHIAPLGRNSDWIKEGLLYYDWNYLILLVTGNEEFIDLANNLKDSLEVSLITSEERKLAPKLIKKIEIITIESREILEYIKIIKTKIKDLKNNNFKIYFNATSGLELWKFGAYFLAAESKLIDKFYYIPKDIDLKYPVKPLEIFLPLKLSKPLKKLLEIMDSKSLSQKDLIKITKLSKGLISRYINNLLNLDLIQIAEKKRSKERFYQLTEKGMWYL